MTRGKQYEKKGVWYFWGKKENKKAEDLLIGLLASIGAPILRELAKPILGKFFGRGRKKGRRLRRRRRRWEKK